MYVNTPGVGFVPAGRDVSASSCRAGDKVLLSGTLGDHHACILSARMGVRNAIASDCACLDDVTSALFRSGAVVRAMRDVTRGGLGPILNEIAASSGRAIEIDEESIPVDGAVMGFCGLMGLDPLYMGNEGKMIAVLEPSGAEEALAAVQDTDHGREAAIIGEVLAPDAAAAAGGRGVVMKTRVGGVRRVDMLYGEGLPRIC